MSFDLKYTYIYIYMYIYVSIYKRINIEFDMCLIGFEVTKQSFKNVHIIQKITMIFVEIHTRREGTHSNHLVPSAHVL